MTQSKFLPIFRVNGGAYLKKFQWHSTLIGGTAFTEGNTVLELEYFYVKIVNLTVLEKDQWKVISKQYSSFGLLKPQLFQKLLSDKF